MKATQAVCEWPGCKTPPAEGAPVCGQHRLWAIGIVAKSPIVDQVEAIKRLEGDTLRWLGDTLRLLRDTNAADADKLRTNGLRLDRALRVVNILAYEERAQAAGWVLEIVTQLVAT
jgi:hypothetical protein